MRTLKFQSILDRVVRKLGRDANAMPSQDMSRSIVDHINDHVEALHQAWDWPEWTITEERAFRQIWNATVQYSRVSSLTGKPDEIFYLGTGFIPGGEFGEDFGYYRVKSSEDIAIDPPVGTLPTNTSFFEVMEWVDAYVEYDQPRKRSIGRVTGVYGGNPRLNGCGCGTGGGVHFRASEKGIDVRCQGGPTVFVTYLMPLPQYTIIPYVVGKTYVRGDVVFDFTTGECFQSVAISTNPPSDSSVWRRIPFLQKWATIVVEEAFADCLLEFDQGGNQDLGAKSTLAAQAKERAILAYQARVDELTAQGQILKWGFCRKKCDGWCESIPWTGGSVTTLTDEDESDLGWVYPPVTAAPVTGIFYFPDVNSLKTTPPTLVAQSSTGFEVGTMAVISTAQHFRLDPGPANEVDPGEGNPTDYNLASHNVHWVAVL